MFQHHPSAFAAVSNGAIGSPAIRDTAIRSMFEARKSVFVDLLGWDVPVLAGRYEIDQFDNEQARYIVMSEPDGNHLGSTRLLATTGPHILGDLYPALCDHAPPHGPDIVEITRFCLDRRLKAARRRQVRDNLVCALADHALAEGISSYVAIAAPGWAAQIQQFGWCCTPLGAPRLADGQALVALRIEIEADTPARLATQGIVSSALPGEAFLAA